MSKPSILKTFLILLICLGFSLLGCDDPPQAIIDGDIDIDSNTPVDGDMDEDRVPTERENLWEKNDDDEYIIGEEDEEEDFSGDNEPSENEESTDSDLSNLRCLSMEDKLNFGAVYTEKEMTVQLVSNCEEGVTIKSLLIRTGVGLSTDFEIVSPKPFEETVVPPQSFMDVKLKYTSRSCKENYGVLQIDTNATNVANGVYRIEMYNSFKGESTASITVQGELEHPDLMDFGDVAVSDANPKIMFFDLQAEGLSAESNRPYEVEDLLILNDFITSSFKLLPTFPDHECDLPICLVPGGTARSCALSFDPIAQGEIEDTLRMSGSDHYPSNEALEDHEITLKGKGVTPCIEVTPANYSLGEVFSKPGVQVELPVSLHNCGTVNLHIVDLGYRNEDSSFSYLDPDGVEGGYLVPDDTEEVKILYIPTQDDLPQAQTGAFRIEFAPMIDGVSVKTVSIYAVAINTCPPATIEVGGECVPYCETGEPYCCPGDDPLLGYYCICQVGNTLGDPIACDEGMICDEGGCVTGCNISTKRCNPEEPLEAQRCGTNQTWESLEICTTDFPNCWEPYCQNGDCFERALSNISCSDGNPCTINDTCENGICSGEPMECDDGNICTSGQCQSGNCVYDPDNEGATCRTDDPCNLWACHLGQCEIVGEPHICDDGDPCTLGVCDAEDPNADENGCVFVFQDNIECDDGKFCTVGEYCDPETKSCTGGTLKQCNDNNVCTRDTCVENIQSCQNIPISGTCDDGDPCTLEDRCDDGRCVRRPGSDLRNCDDGNQCTSDSCDASNPDADELGCVYNVEIMNGTDCNADDDDICTPDDTCSDGVCTADEQIPCNDGNDCTDDTCVRNSGCVFSKRPLDQDQSCDDGNPCTIEDECQNKVCRGVERTCDDDDACTLDTCNQNHYCDNETPDSECLACTHTPTPGDECVYDDPCIVSGVCIYGVNGLECVAGSPVVCSSDNNPCTDEICVQVGDPLRPEGGCVSVPNPDNEYDDDDICTVDDYCDEDGVGHPGPARDCRDGNPCTEDLCGQAQNGCYWNPVSASTTCDDDLVCTTGDYCLNGDCTGREEKTCDDNNPCTENLCSEDVIGGCHYEPFVCDPHHPDFPAIPGCTTCFTDIDCQNNPNASGNFCMEKPGGGAKACVHSCTDGNECTEEDYCAESSCQNGSAVDCNDGKQCSVDTCDTSLGCQHTWPENLPCDDNNECTTSDICTGGICGGTPTDCSDENPCTQNEQCNTTTGECEFTIPVGLYCDDDNPCTGNDKCKNVGGEGVCQGSVSSVDDGNICTYDHCDSEDYQDPFKHENFPCHPDDGTPTSTCLCNTTADCMTNLPNFCPDGVCRCDQTFGICLIDCSPDGYDCTLDICSQDATPVCEHPLLDDTCLISGTCYDKDQQKPSNECEKCDPTTTYYQTHWTPRTGVACTDEGNGCTNDVCDSSGECTHPAYADYTVTCDDGRPCTGSPDDNKSDWCVGGNCQGGDPKFCEDFDPCTENQCVNELGGCYFPELDCSGECLTGNCGNTWDGCEPKADGTDCNDGNNNNYDDQCVSGVCVGYSNFHDPGPCPGFPEMVKVVGTKTCIDKYESVAYKRSDCTGDILGQGESRVDGGSDWFFTPAAYACQSPGEKPSGCGKEHEAEDACSNVGKRLCTLTEWRTACKAATSNTYPYGNTFNTSKCNESVDDVSSEKISGDEQTGCVNGWGVMHMSGNVEEWTRTKLTGQDMYYVTGGRYTDDATSSLQCNSYRLVGNDDYEVYRGFRCCVQP